MRFASAAFGGGTPTFLETDELERLCDIAERRMGADLAAIPLSVEASPATATADRLAVLAARGTTRLSIGVREIRSILDDYTARPAREFAFAEFGRAMDAQESRRRHLLQSLLQAEGMPLDAYRSRFGTSPAEDFPAELERFASAGWLDDSAAPHRLRLSAEGLAHSDAVGPVLFSASVRAAMAAYTAK